MTTNTVPVSMLVLLAGGIPLVVIGLANYPFLTFVLLSLLGISVVYGSDNWFRWGWLFFCSAVFGTLGETMCVYGNWADNGKGLWLYEFPETFGLQLPIWIPLVWGNLFVLYVGISTWLSPSTKFSPESWWGETLRFFIVLGIVAYAGILFRTIKIEILYLFTPLLGLFLIYWTTPRDLTVYFVSATLGTVGEILAMKWELWAYTIPAFSNQFTEWLGIPGLPISLAMAWGISGVFLNRLSKLMYRVTQPDR